MKIQDMEVQRLQLTVALNYLDMIDRCDASIEIGVNVEYFTQVREKAIMNYGNAKWNFCEHLLESWLIKEELAVA